LRWHSGYQFSTKDVDNDADIINCAVEHSGAWWYRTCQNVNLNGRYRNVGPGNIRGVRWRGFRSNYSMKEVSMKIRPYLN